MNASVACSHEETELLLLLLLLLLYNCREEAKQNSGEGSARAFIYLFFREYE